MRKALLTIVAATSLLAASVASPKKAEANCYGCWVGAGVAAGLIGGAIIANNAYGYGYYGGGGYPYYGGGYGGYYGGYAPYYPAYSYGYGYAPYYGYRPRYYYPRYGYGYGYRGYGYRPYRAYYGRGYAGRGYYGRGYAGRPARYGNRR